MKKLLSLLFLFLFSVSILFAKQIKLLTIGNSFSEDAVESYLADLVKADGDTIIIGNMYIGGCSLETHYKNSLGDFPAYSYRKIVNGVKKTLPEYTLYNAFKDEAWDYISFQQVSSESGVYESYFPYISLLIEYAKELCINPNVKFILHATWAYAQNSTHSGFANYGNSQIAMYNAIIDASSRVAQNAKIDLVVPCGTAIQNARTSLLGDAFCRDGFHLELTYGRYTAACTWYEKLFEKSVVGNSFIPNKITAFQAKLAQYAAHKAVEFPERISSLSDFLDDTKSVALINSTNPIFFREE